MEKIDKELLKEISQINGEIQGAYNIRKNGKGIERKITENVNIVNKEDKQGIDIYVKENTKFEFIHIPVIITESVLKDVVYNDFHIGKNANVTIIAGCGIHNDHHKDSEHNGIHRFFLEEGAHVLYEEKHIGTGAAQAEKIIDPVTEIFMGPDSYLEMDTVQLGGVLHSLRKTNAKLEENAKLVIRERLLTDGDEHAESYFEVEMAGAGSGVNLMSRSVAKGNSYQKYQSNIIGNVECTGHSECDAILSDNGRVDAIPMLVANCKDAALIHEAAIGKIAGEQILKLRTLGLTEEEAEAAIIDGFLK